MMDTETVKLNLCEIEILLYVLDRRVELGDHAESAKRKLQAARKALLKAAEMQPRLI